MKGNQPELRFVSNFPKEDTLQLLLDAHTLYLELREEKQRSAYLTLTLIGSLIMVQIGEEKR